LNNENTLTFNDELLTFGQYRAPGLSVFFDGGSFGFCGVRGLSFGGLVLGFVLVVWFFVAVFVVCRVPAMYVPPPLILPFLFSFWFSHPPALFRTISDV
jgi:hypothetical protein